MIDIINDNFNDLAKDYYKLQEEYEQLQQENKQLKERIDKAIEYIKKHNVLAVNKEYLPSGIERCCSAELLEILGDKE